MADRQIPDPQYPEYAELRAEADRRVAADGRFINPATLHRANAVAGIRGFDWCEAVLAHYWHGVALLDRHELYLLILAHDAGINPQPPQWMVDADAARAAARAEQQHQHQDARDRQRQRHVDAWQAITPHVTVDLAVHANPQARAHGTGYAFHLGHAVPTADVYSGTRSIRTHRAGRALCETETRPRPLALCDQPEPAGTPVTCRGCMSWAPKVRTTA